ncbi:MAG: hypothetical protein P4N41_06995 [Negativicutes bacterium]|nr:hypothetical protein [Negativicutes bacterium]
MAIFAELRNECLIRELRRELNTDVILFGFDGNSYFGNLQGIEDDRIAILAPAIKAESSSVEILTAGGEVVHVDFARVDLWPLVGKGTAIVTDPIEEEHHDLVLATQAAEEPPAAGRQESHCLIHILRREIGERVFIGTLGGFLFEGTLGDVFDELAILTVAEIFVPGTSTSISDSRLRAAVVNLEAITSVSTRRSHGR